MCEPISMALAAVSSVIGTGMSVMSSIQQGQAQAAQARYQAQVAENNARVVRLQSEQAAQAQNRQNAMRAGAQRAAFAASGVDPNQGSALTVQEDSAEQGALESANIAYRGLLQGMGLDSEAQLARTRARNAEQAGMMGAIGAGVSGIGQFANRWSSFQNAGGFTGLGKSLGFGGGGGGFDSNAAVYSAAGVKPGYGAI